MGARTNYTIITTDNPAQNINVYAHWDGDESVAIMQSALSAAMPRIKMGDVSYATRIIIDQLTKDGRDSETGYGIYIGEEILAEEQYEYKEIDLVNKRIKIGSMLFDLEQFIAVLT